MKKSISVFIELWILYFLVICPAHAMYNELSQQPVSGSVYIPQFQNTSYNLTPTYVVPGPVQTCLESNRQTNFTKPVESSLCPMPPNFRALSNSQIQELFKLAFSSGHNEALKELLERIYWGAMPNIFKLQNFLQIKDIHKRVMAPHGYLYWYIVWVLDAFHEFPQLAEYIKKQAEKNNYAPAQFFYGSMFEQGKGFNNWMGNGQDAAQAIKWWKKAADQGFALAQNSLGVAHTQGIGGLPKDLALANNYFISSAQQGCLLAYYNYGKNLENKHDAFMWVFSSWQPKAKKWLANILVPIYNISKKSDTDMSNFFASSSMKISELFRCYQPQYIYSLFAGKISDEENKYLVDFFEAYKTWANLYAQVIENFQKAQPGFLITNYDFRDDNNLNIDDQNAYFVRKNIINDNSYVTIGYENIKKLVFLLEYLKSYEDMCKIWKKLKRFYQNLTEYNEKTKIRLRACKRALESLQNSNIVSEAEQQVLPYCLAKKSLLLKAYEHAMPDYKAALDTIKLWINGASELHDLIIYEYVKNGAPIRNREFLESYSFLK